MTADLVRQPGTVWHVVQFAGSLVLLFRFPQVFQTVTSQSFDNSTSTESASVGVQPTPQSKMAVVASSVVHTALLFCLGLVSLTGEPDAVPANTLAAAFDDDDAEPVEVQAVEPLLQPQQDLDDAMAGGQSAAFTLLSQREPAAAFREQRLTSADFPVEASAWSTADLSQRVAGVSRSAGRSTKSGIGLGDGDAAGDGTGNGFFGDTLTGQRFVFVLDCSRSMNHPHDSIAKTRFKRLKMELVRTVAGMSADQEFFFLFFNDEPLAMPASMPVLASDAAKQRYLSWMQPLRADGNTEPTRAMQIALRFRPDVIFFLTDGSFIHRTQLELLRLPFGRTSLHTFAFEEIYDGELLDAYRLLIDGERDAARDAVSSSRGFRKAELAADSVRFLKRLAERHSGEFHLIPHHE